MGQKVHPYIMRIGVNKSWRSCWYASGKEYIKNLREDFKIRGVMSTLPELKNTDISDVEIIRYPQRVTLVIYTSRPGALIGVKGGNIERLTTSLSKHSSSKILIKIRMINRPESNAKLIALYIARQLKIRSAWRRTLKMAQMNAMKAGVKGVKIKVAGRLGGAEMSQNKLIKIGRIPLHTFRADIDYGFAEAMTTYGVIGIKVWIFKGEVHSKEERTDAGKLLKTSGHSMLMMDGEDNA